MTKIWKAAAVLSVAALALLAAVSAGAGNTQNLYTCTKEKNGKTDVVVHVPESALHGKQQAGFTCFAEASDDQGQQGQHTLPPH